MQATAVILGSAFGPDFAKRFDPAPLSVKTEWGIAKVHVFAEAPRSAPAYAIFRHELPHRLLPNQINYRANAAALRQLDCRALLVNSSVGVLDPKIPLFHPMLVSDLLMPENRLPDGSACTMFPQPVSGQGHLALDEGLLSSALSEAVHALDPKSVRPARQGLVFAYAGGPRTKTPAENAALARLGAQVNSMTLAPEIVLANELEIPCAALVAGHKLSIPGVAIPDGAGIAASLEKAREATERLLLSFLSKVGPAPFRNRIHRF